MLNELSSIRDRIAVLEGCVAESEAARRADIERLLREMREIEVRALRAEIELEFWRAGRLKPE